MIQVLITDDHPVVRHGLKQILKKCHDIETVDEASESSEMIKKIIENDYHVMLLDISMPGRSGLDVLKDIKNIRPDLAVLILSVHSEEQYAIRALKLGASGYLTKLSAADELISAVRQAAQGKKYITSAVAEKIAFNYLNGENKPLHQTLSAREYEVMCLLAEGNTLNKIARKLSLSVKTISTYRKRILIKTRKKSTAEIIHYAIKEGLVE